MKNRLLTFAGCLAVLLVLARIYEKPLLAQVRAAFVQDVDEPGRNPFALQGSASYSNSYSFSVPAVKRYVVQNVTAQCFENTPGVLADIAVVGSTNGVTSRVSNQPHLQQSNGPTQNIYTGTGTQVLYADPGSLIRVFADDNLAGGGIDSCEFWVSGHVINNP